MKRAGVRRLRRNLAVAIGNSRRAGGAAQALESHDAPTCRRSARRGAHRVGAGEARWLRGRPPEGGSRAPGRHGRSRGSQSASCCRNGRRCRRCVRSRPDCRACDLYKRGTQTVFGEGPRAAEVMLVGEQPGDAEDRGRPSVRRAGRDAARSRRSSEAGIDRRQVYVTNVVKHFKWEPRGKRRIHAKPNAAEIARLPAVARDGDRAGEAARPGLPRRDRGAGACSARRSRCRSSAASSSTRRWRRSCRDRSSVLDPARAGRRGAAGGDAAVRRRT